MGSNPSRSAPTRPTRPPSARPYWATPRAADPAGLPQSVAILVVHGIGPQRPFQALDSFTGGLVGALRTEGHPDDEIDVTHVKLDPPGDHCIRVQVAGTKGRPGLNLDIHEYWWTGLTQGQASLTDVGRWVFATAFTPLRRVAFNLPLLEERAREELRQRGAAERGPPFTRRLVAEFAREFWRLVYIAVLFVGGAVGAARLVAYSALFARDLFRYGAGWYASGRGPGAADLVTVVLFLALLGAFLALLGSIPRQALDLRRVAKRLGERNPSFLRFLWSGVGDDRLLGVTRGARWGSTPVLGRVVRAWVQAGAEQKRWTVEIPSRRYLLLLSLLGASALLWVLVQIGLGADRWWIPSQFVAKGLDALWQRGRLRQIGLAGGLLLLAVVVKRGFVDYAADIALYTTADDNSRFFASRQLILNQATRKLRWLLRQPRYASVALAGHSLGSAIAYDALDRLRFESTLRATTTPGPPAAGGEAPPLTREEFARLQTFVTFGSPLDKIVYFFRTTLRPYETVRAHIINELHGFRRPPDLLASSWRIGDDPPFDPRDAGVRWLNVYSPMDPISARLYSFRDVKNVRRWYPIWGKAHTDYWHDAGFYEAVLALLREAA